MKDKKLFAKAALFCGAFLLSAITLKAQSAYEITLDIEGLGSNPVLLGNFFGESTYVVDTSVVENGKHIFRGSKALDKGMYFVAKEKQRIFDFVIWNDQQFSLKTATSDYVGNMVVEGDPDNSLFVSDMQFNALKNKEANPHLVVLRDSTASEESKAEAQAALTALNDQVMGHRMDIIEENPGSFMAFYYKAQLEKLPEADADRSELEKYKKNYWSDFDLSDPTLLRLNTPVYKEKVEDYLDRWVYQEADSVIAEIDAMAAVAAKNQDTYKYFVWLVTLKYQNPKIMGLDGVFVHMNDKYFASGEMNFWANEQLRKNVAEYADQLRRSLIGMKAPNMIMLDSELKPKSLYDIPQKFTVIYFFDPDCHHCKLATPVLDELYDSKKFDLQVYAVSTDTSMTKMNDYIRDMELSWVTVNGPRTATEPYYNLYDAMTTPTIYLLNQEKVIIAKKLPVERIEEFLTNYEARRKEEN